MKAFARTFESEFGLIDGAEKLKFAGRTDVSLVREFFSHHQIDPSREHFSKFFAKYSFWLERLIQECKGEVIPGVNEFLFAIEQLKERPVVGLLTGNIRQGAQIKLRHYGLWEKFSFGAFADDHEDRDCIAGTARERASALLGRKLEGSEVLVIGDTPLDVRCARAIGAKVLAVATGSSTREELQQAKADWIEPALDPCKWDLYSH